MSERNLKSRQYSKTPLLNWPEHAGRIRTAFNTMVLAFTKYMPLRVKNSALRALGIKIGENTAVGLGVQMDIFHPEKISIGSNTTIGYSTTILTHETTQNEFREGEVEIGSNVLIGANTTILPGVKIGDGATVSAHSLVNRDVPENTSFGGVPAKNLED